MLPKHIAFAHKGLQGKPYPWQDHTLGIDKTAPSSILTERYKNGELQVLLALYSLIYSSKTWRLCSFHLLLSCLPLLWTWQLLLPVIRLPKSIAVTTRNAPIKTSTSPMFLILVVSYHIVRFNSILAYLTTWLEDTKWDYYSFSCVKPEDPSKCEDIKKEDECLANKCAWEAYYEKKYKSGKWMISPTSWHIQWLRHDLMLSRWIQDLWILHGASSMQRCL